MKKIVICLCAMLVLCVAVLLGGCGKKETKSTLCGVSIKEYAIVYSAGENDYNARAAK